MAPGFPFELDQANLRRRRSLLRRALHEEGVVAASTVAVEGVRQSVAALSHPAVGIPRAGDRDVTLRGAPEGAVREQNRDVVGPNSIALTAVGIVATVILAALVEVVSAIDGRTVRRCVSGGVRRFRPDRCRFVVVGVAVGVGVPRVCIQYCRGCASSTAAGIGRRSPLDPTGSRRARFHGDRPLVVGGLIVVPGTHHVDLAEVAGGEVVVRVQQGLPDLVDVLIVGTAAAA